jgi:glutamate racemase
MARGNIDPSPFSEPLGVFDSGVGGLTVLRALRARLPGHDLLYLGDTARLPYGTKSADTVVRYAIQASQRLVDRGVRALVVACNTASAVALPALRQRFGGMPVIGVVEPGATAACAATRNGHVAVIATEGTVRGGAYQEAIRSRRPELRVTTIACQVFVALAEEGWTDGPVVEAAIARYLDALRPTEDAGAPDTLVLGCTHFPTLAPALQRFVGPQVTLVDSAETVARVVEASFSPPEQARSRGRVRFLATDGAARFARVGRRFLGEAIDEHDVEIVQL